MIEADPYRRNGIWPRVTIREWTVVVGQERDKEARLPCPTFATFPP
jgi:hypothetical protein